jgi:2-amino-4-hydroxy-6-hydroxymethyldihydropteridine diphosphokinase
VEYAEWAPHYERIRREFGFPMDREEAAADQLVSLLPPAARDDPGDRVRRRLKGRDVVVVGLAPRAGPPPLWRLPTGPREIAVVAADGAAAVCLDAGITPTVVATDLDGPVAAEVNANRRGSLVVVHAHGDNPEAMAEWVPQFPGELAGSWAGPPRPALLDPGGFTDGDRSAFLADFGGGERLLLWGFDFENVDESDPVARARKLAKLSWARRLLGLLAERRAFPTLLWGRDASLVPYPPGGTGTDESTTR